MRKQKRDRQRRLTEVEEGRVGKGYGQRAVDLGYKTQKKQRKKKKKKGEKQAAEKGWGGENRLELFPPPLALTDERGRGGGDVTRETEALARACVPICYNNDTQSYILAHWSIILGFCCIYWCYTYFFIFNSISFLFLPSAMVLEKILWHRFKWTLDELFTRVSQHPLLKNYDSFG